MGVFGLRNQIQVHPDGKLEYVKLAERGVPVAPRGRKLQRAAAAMPSAQRPLAGADEEARRAPAWRRAWRRLLRLLGRSRPDRGAPAAGGAAARAAGGGARATSAGGKGSPQSHRRERVPIIAGTGYGQWCRLSDAAERRLLEHFKSTASVEGQRRADGPDVVDEIAFADLRISECPISCNEDVLNFEDAQDRLPWNIEKKMHLHVAPMAPERLKEISVPELTKLPLGLPDCCDAFRGAPFTGGSHALAVVGHINKQQFIAGSGCENTWVRFDRDDLTSTYDYDLGGIPTIRDGRGIIFPVTHLWIDCTGSSSTCAFEWFCGRQCVARRSISLWPLPTFVLKQVLSWAFGRLKGVET